MVNKSLYTFILFVILIFFNGVYSGNISKKKHQKMHAGNTLFLLIQHKNVRIALSRNQEHTIIYSPGNIRIRQGKNKNSANKSCHGRIEISSTNRNNIILKTSDQQIFSVCLPCTLFAESARNYFELGDKTYRGSLILLSETNGKFSVVNFCSVEEYLRGVVPLEIGRRDKGDIEAVKAQAVAARTYTYKKIQKNKKKPFDLLPTVADQVYGGMSAEYSLCDKAIAQTKDEVLIYKGELIYAYYHSTCGGTTANIEDVWNKPAVPYLHSIRDVDKKGKPYCSISKYFTWKESWKTKKLSSILQENSRKAFPHKTPFKGIISGIRITDRYKCGRVAECRINSTNGKYKYGGDKIRFALCRDIHDYPILRSSSFKIIKADRKTIAIKGRGYGHGVGMCQMGAIGRARTGQSYIEILSSYYQETDIAKVTTKD